MKKLAGINGRKVLEIGCVNGRLLRRYAGFVSAVTGLDPNAERLADALAVRSEFENKPIDFVQANYEYVTGCIYELIEIGRLPIPHTNDRIQPTEKESQCKI